MAHLTDGQMLKALADLEELLVDAGQLKSRIQDSLERAPVGPSLELRLREDIIGVLVAAGFSDVLDRGAEMMQRRLAPSGVAAASWQRRPDPVSGLAERWKHRLARR